MGRDEQITVLDPGVLLGIMYDQGGDLKEVEQVLKDLPKVISKLTQLKSHS